MAVLADKGIGPLDQVFELDPDAVAQALVKVLGRSILAVAMGVKETKLVAQWERGETRPHPQRDHAMRLALQVLRVLQRYSKRSIQAWFMGINQHLEDRSPAEVLAQLARQPDADAQRRLLNAARAFANR